MAVTTVGYSVIELDAVQGGWKPIVSMVSESPGIYTWFRKYYPPPPETTTGPEFYKYLNALLASPHALKRKASIRPLFELHLKSKRGLPSPKQARLEILCESLGFRQSVYLALTDQHRLLQQPLYVGKAKNLQMRVKAHLKGRTPLKQRLWQAGIKLEQCTLCFIETPQVDDDSDDGTDVIEDLLSRIFCPPFVARYG